MKCCHDTDCNELMMKKGFTASKKGTWEEYKETSRKNESLQMGLRQGQRDVRVGSTRRDRKYEHCARDHGVSSIQLKDKEESQCPTCARTATVYLWKTIFGGFLVERPQSGGAQFVEKKTDTALKCVESKYWSWREALWSKAAVTSDRVLSDLVLPLWEEVLCGHLGQCTLTHNLYGVECPQEIWAVRRAHAFFLDMEPTVLRELIRLGPTNAA